MDKKILISAALTMWVFALTLVLFVVIVVDLKVTGSDPANSPAVISSGPQQPEIDHPGQKIFKANCTPCHRMREKLVGPALAGVLERRDSLWVIQMIRNSAELIASGDPVATKLFREYNGIQMTSFTSFSDEDLRALLEYIKLETAREDKPAPSRAEV